MESLIQISWLFISCWAVFGAVLGLSSKKQHSCTPTSDTDHNYSTYRLVQIRIQ